MNSPFAASPEELQTRSRRIDLAHQPDFSLGPVQVQPALRTISGPAGETMLEPKVMQVLVALSDPIGAILSREDLTERCWEGRIVGDTSINRVISLLRSAFKIAGGDAVMVENVPKVGYRLVVNGGKIGEEPAPVESGPAANIPISRPMPRSKAVMAGVLMLFVAAIAALAMWQLPSQPPVERLKIAMLPLDIAEGTDPLYGRGLEAELRAQFARIGSVEVTSGDSARHLMEKGLDPTEIGRKLNADYIWTGSLQVGAERVTLAASLVDPQDSQQVWSDQLASGRNAARFLPMRTAREMASALGRTVAERTPDSAVSSEDYSLYLTAMGLIKTRGDDQRVAALQIMQQVTQRSPEFAEGWAGLAKAYFLLPEGDENANEALALDLANTALALDPQSVDALKLAGMLRQDGEERLALLKQAIALDPGDVEAWFWLALTQRDFQLVAAPHIESSLRMIELDPLWPASWRASSDAVQFGQIDLARRIERDILAAAVTPSQSALAEGRLARIDGDLSTYVEKAQEASGSITTTERRYSLDMHMGMIEVLLGVQLPGELPYLRTPEKQLMYRMHRRELPSVDEIRAVTGGDGDLWDMAEFVGPAIPLFLENGRAAELLSLYDARFSSHADFLAYAEAGGRPEFIVPQISPFLALALRDAGRESEAEAHLSSAEQQIERWNDTDKGWIIPILFELDLAAARDDRAKATEIIEALPAYGWPYVMADPDISGGLLLGSNPLYAAIRDLPQVRAVLDPIRANLERERAEILALGVS
ncbi:winged helix-turn-helix domain-containing protein [Erythrobacter rubeus]|uniref:Winged helix-turn-helix domain-containing protein n=1 Tax=Erythrobacter rubeus TaxID=2760803 RepID=A0ABR8KPS4_9SPHN|nr:winged helix-turn-helix domain-containing protein [Erythrobacter rubeus]MBD2841470.1 winged helix-turn-helix domain-containing protein [Erythrobacter rubeus]